MLRPQLEAGSPVIGLDPSCTAVFRADAPELVPGDQDVQRLARQVMKFDADVLDEGCCGLAGDFGFERGHPEVSPAVAEQGVLPAVRAALPGSLLLPDGFSCRTRVEQGDTGRRALHCPRPGGHLPAEHPERLATRPDRPSRTEGWATTAGATALTATAATAACRAALRSMRRPWPAPHAGGLLIALIDTGHAGVDSRQSLHGLTLATRHEAKAGHNGSGSRAQARPGECLGGSSWPSRSSPC